MTSEAEKKKLKSEIPDEILKGFNIHDPQCNWGK